MAKTPTKKPMTLGDIPGIIAKLQTTQLLYVLLLVAVFAIGYLLARVQSLEKGGSATAVAGTQQQQQAGAQPVAEPTPDPKDVIAKLTDPHLPIRGNEDAKVKVVEFSDFECPYCAAFHKDTLPQLIKDYIDTGKISFEYRHFPLSFHPQAKPLAIAAECANDQGKFWEMHDKIFEENSSGSLATADTDKYKEWAVELGLDTQSFNSCLDSENHADVVDSDTQLGSSVGVSGTPTFYINGRQLVGAQPITAFKTIIDEELEK